MFSKKPTKIYEIFTNDLTLCSKRQINGDNFIYICGLLRKYELYKIDHMFFGWYSNFQITVTIPQLVHCQRKGDVNLTCHPSPTSRLVVVNANRL